MVGFGISPTPNGNAGRENVLFNKTSTDCQNFGNLSVDNAMFLCFDETTGTGTCSGDSGGPALAMIGGVQKIVGVTSFGDVGCTQMGAHMRTDAGKAWLESAAPELGCTADGSCNTACGSNGLPQDPDCPVCAKDSDCGADMVCGTDHLCEPAPMTPGGLGAECGAGHTACVVGMCANGPDGQRCSESCSSASDCGDGFDCLTGGANGGACWPSGSGGGGCSVSGRSDGSAALLLLGAALFIRRRKQGAR
jgi:MYXO-CTERM domain-containing protein